MATIKKKFIGNDQVDETKIRLNNDSELRARNAANDGDVDILKVDASDEVQMSSFFKTPVGAPAADYDTANKKYVDDSVAAATPDASDVDYDNTASGLTATNVQDAIDEVEGRVDSAEDDIADLQTLSGVAANATDLGTFTGSTIPDASDNKEALQALETAVEARALDSAVIKKDGSVAFTADQSMGGNQLTNVGTPGSATDAATKGYVDALSEGLKPKAAVRAGTLVAGTLISSFEDGDVIDGVTLATGDRILIKNQAAPEENGIYIVEASGAPTRAPDFDSLSPIDEINGAYTFIQEGTQAGQGWVQSGSVAVLDTDPVNFVWFNSATGVIGGDMITVTGSTVSVDLLTNGGLKSSNPGNVAGELQVSLEASNPSLEVNGSNELKAKLDAAGAITSGASGLSVGTDDSTIEKNANVLRVKDAGITLAKMASNSVDENKIVSTAISTTGGLNGGGGTKVAVRVDASTTKINGSNNLESLKHREQKITLNGTDITNQYVDLAVPVHGVDAANNSVSVFVVGGPMQEKAIDYTVSLTGGSGGVTRITFAGDLATGGAAELIAADILVIAYDYLT